MAGKVIDLLRLRAVTDEYERRKVFKIRDRAVLIDERVWQLIEAARAGQLAQAQGVVKGLEETDITAYPHSADDDSTGKMIDQLRERAVADQEERRRQGMPDTQMLPDERIWALIEAVRAGDLEGAQEVVKGLEETDIESLDPVG